MATTYKTPGVYVEEISKLPPSVAQVETAIPAFVGYTQKAEKNGENLLNKPTRLGSMLEYVQYYGSDNTPLSIAVVINTANNNAVETVTVGNTQRYLMYDCLRTFFDNGGGDCYIVSVGLFGSAPVSGDENSSSLPGLRVGVKALEKYDEPTIILFPDAVNMLTNGSDDPNLYSLQQMVLEQCAKLQDRVGLFDLKENISGDLNTAISNYRNNIGINNLKYAAAYTPWIQTTYPRDINFETFNSLVTALGGGSVDLSTLSSDSSLNEIVVNTNTANGEVSGVNAVLTSIRKADPLTGNLNVAVLEAKSLKDKFNELKKAIDTAANDTVAKSAMVILLNFCRKALLEFNNLKTTLTTESLKKDLDSYAKSNTMWRGAAQKLIALDRNDDVRALSGLANTAVAINSAYPSIDTVWLDFATPSLIIANPKDFGDSSVAANLPAIGRLIAIDLQNIFNMLSDFADSLLAAAQAYKKANQDTLYEKHPVIGNIVKSIKKELSKVPPSGAVAGVYARVDNARGVWKAPANESLNSVSGPTVQITAEQQANINVDAVAGKSINAIRVFTGKGTLVWGARTLAGNDNEWRYISVRRFFNMVEESSKKATEPFVFEPNDANTWVKIQGMLENFLTTLWRQGALHGAKPEHAFYVAVGLGKTMTALDILEGRLIVEIGMAVVRPAEFIILRFSHKLAES
ncbi:MAG TPA: phage tail sheath C-terminal domain-containing protein [Prolixibacteraceae bacterium]|nr:phage tail sheath C-terminal domain-containing protein [Prolixibacteraceae bacterium]